MPSAFDDEGKRDPLKAPSMANAFDEEEDDEDDDDDHESESSRESHFEGANDENDDGIEDEGDEDEDEGDEDDDDDQFQELEEAIYRFPLGDNGDDDLDLMIQYPDESNIGHNHIEESRMARAIHLPLWSDMMSQGMG